MRILKEPLFHFSVLGAALFVWFAQVNSSQPETDILRQIIVDDQDAERLAQRFEASRQRPPTDQELATMVETLIRQEVLVREARALGMEAGDEVVRNRLVQKMNFLLESGVGSQAPEDAELSAHLKANSERFKTPGMVAFEQVYLGEAISEEDVAAIKTSLTEGADPSQIGRVSQLPPYMPPSRKQRIDGMFGRGVFNTLETLPVGTWEGPVQSGFGWHLIRVTDSIPATVPNLEDVRDKVLAEWMREKASELSEARYDALKVKYEIIRPDRFEQVSEAGQ